MHESIIAKTCTKCCIEKALTEFCKQSSAKDGLNYACKACSAVANVAYRASNQEKIKTAKAAYYATNTEKVKTSNASYLAANPEKTKAYHVGYRAANAKKIKAYQVGYYAANQGKLKTYHVGWRATNIEKIKACNAASYAANPEVHRIYWQNRRARKLEVGGVLSKGLSVKLFKSQKGKCPCCGLPLGKNFHLDHNMPLALGGSNTDGNMQLLRQRCNNQKGAKHPVDFMQQRGFLL